MPESIATLTKDGQTREAFTPADLVSLKYAGWKVRPTADPAPEPAELAPDPAPSLSPPPGPAAEQVPAPVEVPPA